MEPVEALERIAFLLERNLASSYKTQAFRRAARTVKTLDSQQLTTLAASKKLKTLPGVGASTEEVILQAMAGETPEYLQRLEAEPWLGIDITGGKALMSALQGDCHMHSDWSDGGSSIEEMAHAARDFGHSYMVLTDHSPNLKVANGLTAERLIKQLAIIDELNASLAPFRILKGIEVDILEDGTLDQTDEMFAQLDVVVASVHSALRSDEATMTKRMLSAIANPRTNILGHCTGRKVTGKGRPPSSFDATAVFEACVEHDVAVEINSRPERKDPPMELLRLAAEIGCKFSIDSDAHAPGQLTWLPLGAERAEQCDISAERIVNTLTADELTAWSRQ